MAVWLSIAQAFLHVLASPFKDLSVLWQIIPILVMWLVLEIYFVHWHEELGWNSALANAITLLWVTVTMMQVIFGDDGLWSWMKFSLLLVGVLYACLLIYITFKHSLKAKWAFMIGSPTVIHYLCMVFILWAHGSLEISWQVFIALAVFFGFFIIITYFLKKFFGKDPKNDDSDPFSDSKNDSFGSSSGASSNSSLDSRSSDLLSEKSSSQGSSQGSVPMNKSSSSSSQNKPVSRQSSSRNARRKSPFK